MLNRRRRWRDKIKSTLGQCLVFSGSCDTNLKKSFVSYQLCALNTLLTDGSNYYSFYLRRAHKIHLPDSQARCSRGLRPSLAESVLSSTYWGREDDLDIEYSLIFQQNANLMLAHCLRRWLNINPTLPHVTSCVWWDVVGAVCDTSCEILGNQTCAA